MGVIVALLGASAYVWAIVSAPIVVAAILTIIVRPELGLILVFLLSYNPIVSSLRLNLVIASYIPVFAILGATALGVLASRKAVLSQLVYAAGGKTYLPMGLFVFCLFFSAVYGWASGNYTSYVVSDLVQMIEMPLVYWLTLRVLARTDKTYYIAVVLLAVFTLTATWNLTLYFKPGDLTYAESGVSAVAIARIGEETATRLLSDIPTLFLPIIISLLLVARAQLPVKLRVMLSLAGVVATAHIVLSLTRSAWGGQIIGVLCLIGLAAYIGHFRRAVKYLTLLLLPLLLLLILAIMWDTANIPALNLVSDRLRFTIDQIIYGNAGLDVRLYEYQVANFTLLNSPVVGWGLGWQYSGYFGSGGLGLKHWMHNVYIAIWSRMGLLGLASFGVYIGSVLLVLVRRVRWLSDISSQAIILGVIASFVGFAAQSFLWGTLFSHPNSALIGLGIGLAVHLANTRSSLPISQAGASQ